MKLAIIGGRDFLDYELLKSVVDKVKTPITLIVSGGANGADRLAERYARERGIPTKIFPAEWDKYDKRAGFLRNVDIITEADGVIAFWDGESRGTKSSIEIAEKQGKKVYIKGY